MEQGQQPDISTPDAAARVRELVNEPPALGAWALVIVPAIAVFIIVMAVVSLVWFDNGEILESIASIGPAIGLFALVRTRQDYMRSKSWAPEVMKATVGLFYVLSNERHLTPYERVRFSALFDEAIAALIDEGEYYHAEVAAVYRVAFVDESPESSVQVQYPPTTGAE